MTNEENKDEIKRTAKEIISNAKEGERVDFFLEKNEYKEKEISKEEQIVKDEIRRELDLMDLDENLKKESENKSKQIQFLGEEEKIKHLLDIAKQKGVVFALKVANNMNDPYVLDIFHDVLVREGLWKRFEK
ncbi:MAG: hypothetical protein A2312_00795 [Candidatus Staskawiczbacteria bacterium RIFOXYB2_FULL_32_9]|uniref:Uncharacterized protein n=1 Tax=Candidatus Staskawiczbacteria bacterium RIFOXYD1_FULL_32_13 TaxID=1802234 RepID=A0A1G2JKL5_9BACT|nr:MAG: hypothetical protein UR22_C0001G0031 [Parcubacteria group bacterium GW2011_GWC2_32_10]OGZ79739.1 MAG: hypothetical protein A2360_04810 [Candidatus Staskawiczbacteria bacterium RIFOXYB1_FULL_32_11]OGZ84453.1 MAG: hypothetical protein A2312_00795 [Candidatus Staskawiczbacteria bacterium RIFOXYB2_FULL_32_9]OGZ87669.1 MAG: hypothetical protein A2561_03150 [Candidatus Staskawiczbacteria bacterium RIFOXYD1_FULL_32_13]